MSHQDDRARRGSAKSKDARNREKTFHRQNPNRELECIGCCESAGSSKKINGSNYNVLGQNYKWHHKKWVDAKQIQYDGTN